MVFPFIPPTLKDTTKVWDYEAPPRSGLGFLRMGCIRFQDSSFLTFVLPSLCLEYFACLACLVLVSDCNSARLETSISLVVAERG